MRILLNLTKNFALTIAFFGGLMLVPVTVVNAQVDSVDEACEALEAIGESCDSTEAEGKIDSTIKAIIDVISWIVGIASLIVIIIAGIRFVLSGGDANTVTSARGSIIYAFIGIVVVVLARVIVNLFINKVG